MVDVAYKCLNEKCNIRFHGVNIEGVRCPLCGNQIRYFGKFPDYFTRDILSYDSLKKTKTLGGQAINEKSIEEFKKTGLLWFVNNLLHVFGWAIVIDIDNGKETRMYPARVKFRGFSEKHNDKGYMKVSQYMKDNAATLLSEIEE